MNTFKSRWTQHCSDFRVFRPKAKTTLCKKVWELKNSNNVFNVKWKIVDRDRQYTSMPKSCNLCTSEVYHILFNPQNATLNSRNELKGHCRHWEQFRLSNFKTWQLSILEIPDHETICSLEEIKLCWKTFFSILYIYIYIYIYIMCIPLNLYIYIYIYIYILNP